MPETNGWKIDFEGCRAMIATMDKKTATLKKKDRKTENPSEASRMGDIYSIQNEILVYESRLEEIVEEYRLLQSEINQFLLEIVNAYEQNEKMLTSAIGYVKALIK